VTGTHTIQAFAPGRMRFSIATGFEHRLPWMLDMVFRVDLTRLRSANSPDNMAIVRHVALNLLSCAKPITSFKNRRKKAGGYRLSRNRPATHRMMFKRFAWNGFRTPLKRPMRSSRVCPSMV
jgi:hypothetical protein